MPSILRLFICFTLLITSACATSSTEKQALSKDNNIMHSTKQGWQQVKVVYLSFEGGFYGLITENGTKLLPMNLAKEYKISGTVLKISGHEIKDLMTTKQWGQAYKIDDVRLITLGKGQQNNIF